MSTATRLLTEAKRAVGFSLGHHVLLNSPSLSQLHAKHVADLCFSMLSRAKSTFLPSHADREAMRVVLITPHRALVEVLRAHEGAQLAGCAVFSTDEVAALLDTAPPAVAPPSGGAGSEGEGSRSHQREVARMESRAPAAAPKTAFLLKSAAHPELGAFHAPAVILLDMNCRITALTQATSPPSDVHGAIDLLYRLFGLDSGHPFHLLTALDFEREEREGKTTALFLSADAALGGMGDTDAHVMALVPKTAAGGAEEFTVIERP